MAPQSTFTQAVADEICQRLAEGETLRAICRSEGMPAWRTVYDWSYANPEFAAAIARARDEGFDAIASETLEIVDQAPPTTQFGSTDSGYVSWQKMRAEQRMKLLAKWDPKRYGDKLDLNHSGALNITVQKLSGKAEE